ncbi:hypothetical protein MLD38_038750 [Melastoma candidum]|uniref:Uncharacterized protein n=1 Tax=Melastoma candidum TaxID=119954 RepID=A0ACB9L082_9MYRT|nr:hypothetical protein MLD38_038750 [Melastoma candidum]
MVSEQNILDATLPPATPTTQVVASSGFGAAGSLASPPPGFGAASPLTSSLPGTAPVAPIYLPSPTPLPPMTTIVTVKLSSDNYPVWLSFMTSYLHTIDMLPYVDGTIRQPPPEVSLPDGRVVSNPTYRTWLRLNHNLRANILATLTPEMMMEVYDILPAYEIWSTLHARFQQATLARELELRNRLLSLRLTNQSMAIYLRDLKTVADQLTAIGKPISTSELVLYALRGLPRSYESLVSTLSYSVINQTFDQVRASLLNYEQRLKELEPDFGDAHPGALFSAASSSRRRAR